MSPDKNVEAVRTKLLERSQFGLAKYGVTTERTDTDLVGWLNHLQEELMDAAVYAQRSMVEIEKQEPIYQLQSADGRWIDQDKHSYDYNVANGHSERCRIVFTAPVVSPDVEKLRSGTGVTVPADKLREMQSENQSLKAELEAARKDAESWRSYKKRKDEVIAAGMGRNVLREAAIEQAKPLDEADLQRLHLPQQAKGGA